MIQPTGEPQPPEPLGAKVYRALLGGLFGRVIEWIRDLFRTDDQKIEAIVARALTFPKEQDWALDHIVRRTLYTNPHTEFLTTFLKAVTTPIASAEKAPALLALQLRVRLATTTIQETEVLAQLVSLIDGAKQKWGDSFSLEKLGASLLQLSDLKGPLLCSFATALQTNNPDPFFDEVGNLLFQGAPQPEKLIEIALSTASSFSITSEAAWQKIVNSVCTYVEAAPLTFNPPKMPLTPKNLEDCLFNFTRLHDLSVLLKAEDKVDAALRGRFEEFEKRKELKAAFPEIIKYICGDKTIVFESLKECLAVIEKCPKEIQKVVLIGLRDELKKRHYSLQDEQLQELPLLERTIFRYSSEQTSKGIDDPLNPPPSASAQSEEDRTQITS